MGDVSSEGYHEITCEMQLLLSGVVRRWFIKPVMDIGTTTKGATEAKFIDLVWVSNPMEDSMDSQLVYEHTCKR